MKQFAECLACLSLLVCLFIPASLAAHEFKSGDLTIDHPWSRATPAGAKTAAGYLTITNKGKDADRLVGGTAEGVETVEVHEMAMENNVMRMRHLEKGLEIKAGATVELKPGSYHMMMIGLKEPFKKGQTIKGTLIFEKAGTLPVVFEVDAMDANAGGHKH